MLRVRPILYTPYAAEWAKLLTVLGLERIGDSGPGAALVLGTDAGSCFAAGAGRVLVCEAESFGIELGFEVRDVQRFAEWTIGDGTDVILREEPTSDGPVNVAHLVAPDGVAFEARPVDPTVLAGTPAAQEPPHPASGQSSSRSLAQSLSVVAQWRTPDVPGTCSTLENIGAKAAAPNSPGSIASYRAKHGGFIDVFETSQPDIDLTLEYAGSATVLEERMAMAGYEVLTLDYGDDATAFVGHPDGGRIQVACTFRDGE